MIKVHPFVGFNDDYDSSKIESVSNIPEDSINLTYHIPAREYMVSTSHKRLERVIAKIVEVASLPNRCVVLFNTFSELVEAQTWLASKNLVTAELSGSMTAYQRAKHYTNHILKNVPLLTTFYFLKESGTKFEKDTNVVSVGYINSKVLEHIASSINPAAWYQISDNDDIGKLLFERTKNILEGIK